MPTRDGDNPPTASEMNEVMTIDSGDSARQANTGEASECRKTALRGNTLQTRRYLGVVYGRYRKDTQVLCTSVLLAAMRPGQFRQDVQAKSS